MSSRIAVLVAFLLVLSVPFLVRTLSATPDQSTGASAAKGARRLVVVTPHVEQIQVEFARGFDRWHRRVHNAPVTLDWRTPGGTSEIIKQIEATFDAAARKGLCRADGSFPDGTAGYDVFFGGGSFEHSKMKEVKTSTVSSTSAKVTYRMGQPAGFPQATLDALYGENAIGAQNIYDPEQYWLGTALSGFGIVFNRDMLKARNLPEPTSFQNLCDYRYAGLLALTDGRLSGSITTSYDSILNNEGWERGWRTLREMAANARYFASAAPKAPIDVGQGEAAAGLAIDFYGRGQAQFLRAPGEPESASRVGYIDPAGTVYIDADPISIFNGATDLELAKRFVEFCLTEEAQSLWQFPVISSPAAANSPKAPDGRVMGPDQYELRRMPVRRVMYQKYAANMIDHADPFAAASKVKTLGWRSAIGPMMAAFAIDTRPELIAAWHALNAARNDSSFPSARLKEMEDLFLSFPPHHMRPATLLVPDSTLKGVSKPAQSELSRLKITTFDQLAAGLPAMKASGKVSSEVIAELQALAAARPADLAPVILPFTAENFRTIRTDTDSWKDPVHGRQSLINYTNYFRQTYRRIVELSRMPAEKSGGV